MGSEGWQQAAIRFADRQTAEDVAVGCLRPALVTAQAHGLIAAWFFTRKTPCWRLRYQPTKGHAWPNLGGVLDGLAADGRITGWTTGIYEPEVHTFGGPAAMNLAHDLFGDDSRQILDYLAPPDSARATPAASAPRIGRRELTMLLCSVLLRSWATPVVPSASACCCSARPGDGGGDSRGQLSEPGRLRWLSGGPGVESGTIWLGWWKRRSHRRTCLRCVAALEGSLDWGASASA
jgi:hypothetical protein